MKRVEEGNATAVTPRLSRVVNLKPHVPRKGLVGKYNYPSCPSVGNVTCSIDFPANRLIHRLVAQTKMKILRNLYTIPRRRRLRRALRALLNAAGSRSKSRADRVARISIYVRLWEMISLFFFENLMSCDSPRRFLFDCRCRTNPPTHVCRKSGNRFPNAPL